MRDFYGWRARIGLIYPSSSTVMEPELYAMAPEGVSIHTARQDIGPIAPDSLRKWAGEDGVEKCTRQLAQAPLHSIILGGTSASFIEGKGWDEKVCARMEAVSGGIPATTATTAVTKALHLFGHNRVAFVTAYTEEVNERGRKFLAQHGFNVVSSTGMGIVVDPEISTVSGERVYDFARRSVTAEAEILFISCTGLRTVGVISALEEDLGIPVVTSNQASFWHALRLAGVNDAVPGFGRLFNFTKLQNPGD